MRLATWVSLFVCSLLVLAPAAKAADGNPAYTNPEEAGLDYTIQGEYTGMIAADGSRWGAQVIALGDGKFRSVGYFGGLPGDGWMPGADTNTVDGKLSGGVAVFDFADFVIKVDGKSLKIETLDGEQVGELPKVTRTSPTLGAQPPAGALVLFDGSNVDQWNNGTIVEGKYLAATNPDSKETFGDHTLHVEFRTPFMPKSSGQGRGNSGVYIQSRYELQVLDSFGLEGLDNECGGIYSIGKPLVNMCFPPLAWQTYDIEFKAARFDPAGTKTANARVTIRHNGVIIHNDRELPHATPGRLPNETAEPAPLYLQDHGNPVVYRNIWVVKQ